MNFSSDNDFAKTTVIKQSEASNKMRQNFKDENTLVMPRELIERSYNNVIVEDVDDEKRPRRRNSRPKTHYFSSLFLAALVVFGIAAGYMAYNIISEEKQALDNQTKIEMQKIEQQKQELEIQQQNFNNKVNQAKEEKAKTEEKTAKTSDNKQKSDEKKTDKSAIKEKATAEEKTTDKAATEKAAAESAAKPPAPEKKAAK
jgi:type IV secretory pathway VirB10-like protein